MLLWSRQNSLHVIVQFWVPPNGLSLLVRLQHFVCAFSVCGGGERGDKEHNNSTAELHFYYFWQKKRETPKKNDPSKPRNCIELSLNCLWFVWNSRLAGNLFLSYFSWIFILQARSSSFFNWDKIYRRRRLSCGGERMATPIPIAVTTKLKLQLRL